jgi:hypothetical protein
LLARADEQVSQDERRLWISGGPHITAQAGGFRICATKVGAQVTILHIKIVEDTA